MAKQNPQYFVGVLEIILSHSIELHIVQKYSASHTPFVLQTLIKLFSTTLE